MENPGTVGRRWGQESEGRREVKGEKGGRWQEEQTPSCTNSNTNILSEGKEQAQPSVGGGVPIVLVRTKQRLYSIDTSESPCAKERGLRSGT